MLDLPGQTPVDAYEIPRRYRADTGAGREPCQTRLDNLAPLTRPSHRVKTHGHGWTLASPSPGIHRWRTPHGYCFQRDAHGTTPLGKHSAGEFQAVLRELLELESWDQLTDRELAG